MPKNVGIVEEGTCISVFKNEKDTKLKEELTMKWIEIINCLERNRK